MNRQLTPLLLCAITLWPFQTAFSQDNTINGYVVDEKSGEYLPYATVVLSDGNLCTTTNNYGYFSMSTNSDNGTVKVSYVGYQPKEFYLSQLSRDSLITFKLTSNNELEEVIVQGDKADEKTPHLAINSVNLSMKELDKIPVILGEQDVLKTLQLMPGFTGGLDGTSSLYVRGGDADQNHLLLDGVTVYNANHLFGIFSVFNPDALKSVNAMKGAFPARYGGRLSSVIDIQMKEGNNQKYKGDISVGLLSSKFTLEGPIKKDKTSFIISGRRTYLDFFTRLISELEELEGEEFTSGYYFYDLNAKVNHKINDKSHLFLSAYLGYDKAFLNCDYIDANANYNGYGFSQYFNLNWGNRTFSLRYNYILKPNLFANITTIYSHYQYSHQSSYISKSVYQNEITTNTGNSYTSSSGINDLGVKADFDLYANQDHAIKFGAGYINHKHIPEICSSSYMNFRGETVTTTDTTFGSQNIYANETYLYMEDDWSINDHFKTNFGLRFSSFSVQGKNYLNLDPRFSLKYLVSNRLSFEAAYSHMYQYTHLLSNSSSGLPTDLWLPSTKNIPPSISNQFSIGGLYKTNAFEFTAEAYYKSMQNLIEYSDQSYYNADYDYWEDEVEIGTGNSYGIELMARKNIGAFTGWAGYTLSWSNRIFENINDGNPFPATYDRRHDLSIVLNYKLNERIDFGATWVYNSGLPKTLPVQKYTSLDGNTIYLYSDRNAVRLPDYHRLDLCVNFRKQKKRGERIWTLGIYNVYNQLNPIFIETSEDNARTKLTEYALPIMPYFSYTFRFK